MGLDFLIWLIGVAASNFLLTVPLYLLVSGVINKIAKGKDNFGLKIFAINYGLLMLLMMILEAFTIANMVTMFFEVLLLIWIGNTLYYKRSDKSM